MDHQSSHQAHNSDPKLSRAINVRRAGEARALHQTLDEQMRILTAIKASLAVHHETLDDADLMMVLAEGETSLLETIDALLEADMYDEALLDGLKLQKDTLAVRLHRFRERRESRRSILEQALTLLEQKSLERPIGTLTLANRPPSLVIEEEAQIPARFFDLRPVLNKRSLKQALDGGEHVQGARLANGAITLTLRRR
jgi:hypothetical protein